MFFKIHIVLTSHFTANTKRRHTFSCQYHTKPLFHRFFAFFTFLKISGLFVHIISSKFFFANIHVHLSLKNIQFYHTSLHIWLIFHSEISHFDLNPSIFVIFDCFSFFFFTSFRSFSCRAKWATTTTCFGAQKATFVCLLNITLVFVCDTEISVCCVYVSTAHTYPTH